MTKSTITREQLLEIIETDHVQCGEASYLARMALAAMGSESVGTLSVRHMSYSGKKIGNQFGFVHSDAAMTIAEGDYPLYRHAQPVAAVPGNSITVIVSQADIFDVEGGKTYAAGKMINLDTLRDYLAEHKINVEVH